MEESELARVMRQIEDKYTASKRGLEGLAAVARHEAINARTRALTSKHEQLIQLVGAEKAIETIATIYFAEIED